MLVDIAPAVTGKDKEAALAVRRQVFGVEMGVPLAYLDLPEYANGLQLLARDRLSGDPVASLTLLETTGHLALHREYRLPFGPDARSVRYTQLSVLKPYRGHKLSLRLMLEGYRRFVEPERFDYSWLVFNAGRAASSLWCQLLGFTPGTRTVTSAMGRSLVLSRNERLPACQEAIGRAQAFAAAFDGPLASLSTGELLALKVTS